MGKYVGLHIILWSSAILYYTITVRKIFEKDFESMYPFFALTVLFNLLIEVAIVLLGITEPGIIPKILQFHDQKKNVHIPRIKKTEQS